LARKLIRLKYPSPDRFLKDWALLRDSKVFVPSKNPSPAGTELTVEIVVPGIEDEFILDGAVISDDRSEGTGKTSGILVAFPADAAPVLSNLESALRASNAYRDKLAPIAEPAPPEPEPPKPGAETGPALEVTAGPLPPHGPPQEQAPQTQGAPLPPGAQSPPEPTPPPAPKIKISLDQDKTEHKPREHVREYIRPPKPQAVAPPPAPEPKPPARSPAHPPAPEPPRPAPTPPPPAPEPKPRAGKPEPAAPSSFSKKLAWVKEVIAQAEMKYEDEVVTPPPPPPAEKKELTAEERERVKPVGDFIMDLAKAMLRSGYYAPDHPGAKDAKQGLFEQLEKALGDDKEFMLTNQETRERTDVLITGILDEPVSVRTVVGAGMAELFVPRFRDYYNRKGLVSFAIKKGITPEHFDAFVDIMSDPKADRGEGAKVGDLLTKALISAGISEISSVFMDDMILVEEKLPWRAEMAINRLAKDLKVLPMFKGKSHEEMKKLKVQIIQDIIRPLRHPFLLKDIVLNCYVIAKHVEDIEAEDLEQTIIACFPMQMLLPTSRFIFDELARLRSEREEHADNEILNRRFQGVKRIMKWIAQRVVLEDVQGAKNFLEQLYFNEILAFEELPPEVQYRINTLRLADDLEKDLENYIAGLLHATVEEDAMALLKSFHRVAPILIERKKWAVILELAKGVDKAAAEAKVFRGGAGLPANPLIFIFHEYTDQLVEAYEKAEKAERALMDEVIPRMGPLGVEVLIKVLAQSQDRGVRKAVVDALIKQGDLSRRRVRQILDDPRQQWFLQRNSLLIIGHIGQGDEDIARSRRLLKHSQPRLREEALNTSLKLEGRNAEPLVISALHDTDKRVQRRALGCLSLFQPPSESSVNKILELIKKERPGDKEQAVEHDRWIAQLIRALGGMAELPNQGTVEETILQMASDRAALKGGLFKRFKKAIEHTIEQGKEEPVVLEAAIEALGKIGSEKSLELLDEIAKLETPQAKTAKEAADRIRIRTQK